MQLKYKCEICGRETTTARNFAIHIVKKHKDITLKEYYDKFLKKPDEGICKTCGKPTRFLCIERGYRSFCCRNCIFKNDEVNEKKTNTFIKIHGSTSPMKDEKVLEKMRQTNMERIGTPYALNNPEKRALGKQTKLREHGDENWNNHEKYKETCKEKWGVENYFQTKEFKDSYEKYMKETYKVRLPLQYPEFAEKSKKTKLNNSKKKYQKLDKNNTVILNDIDTDRCYCTCNTCHKDFVITRLLYRKRIRNNEQICMFCNSPYNKASKEEKEVLNYIKTIYTGPILENDRQLIKGFELDMYFPELNLAIEFDGAYWHMDNRFYKSTDVNKNSGKTAQEIWDRDKLKEQKATEKGLTLIRIKEYDWLTDKELIKQQLLEQFK